MRQDRFADLVGLANTFTSGFGRCHHMILCHHFLRFNSVERKGRELVSNRGLSVVDTGTYRVEKGETKRIDR